MDTFQQLHQTLLDILLEFDRICRKHHLHYSLAYGTLLGAVRHKGFIPWDDDVDVLMPRKDFEAFCRICPRETTAAYFFQSKQTEPKYPYNICRLRKNNTAMIYNTWKKSGIHQGLYIDIYPVDRIADNPLAAWVQKWMVIFCTPVRVSRNAVIYKNGFKKSNRVLYTLKNCFYYAAKCFPKAWCDKIEHYFITKYNNQPSRRCGVICEGGTLLCGGRTEQPFPTEYLDGYQEIMFEGHPLQAVTKTEELLTHWYGDYRQLPPEEKRVMTHRPDVMETTRSYTDFI